MHCDGRFIQDLGHRRTRLYNEQKAYGQSGFSIIHIARHPRPWETTLAGEPGKILSARGGTGIPGTAPDVLQAPRDSQPIPQADWGVPALFLFATPDQFSKYVWDASALNPGFS